MTSQVGEKKAGGIFPPAGSAKAMVCLIHAEESEKRVCARPE